MLGEDFDNPVDQVEAITTAALERASREPHSADFHLIRRITRFHTTPLPDAQTLAAYAKLVPNGADRLLSLVEREADHRHPRDLRELRHLERSHWMAFSLAVALSGAGLYLGETGHDGLAGVLFMSTVGAVVTALVIDKRGRLSGQSVPPPADR